MSGRYRVRRHVREQHIGDQDGRIAFWMDETTATDLAHSYGVSDLAYAEILDAVERAYSEADEDEDA